MARRKSKWKMWLNWISWVLLIVGGLNWGLIGGFDYNLVQQLLGNFPIIVDTVYVAVGLSAFWAIISVFMKSMRMK